MRIRWRLRMAAAQREVWTGTELRRLLAEKAGLELSSASVSALFTKEPSQLKMTTLGLVATAFGMDPQATLIYLADHVDREGELARLRSPARRQIHSPTPMINASLRG